MNRLTQPSMLAWLRTATPQLVAMAQHAPLRFVALPPRAAWLRALRIELLEAHIRNEKYGERERERVPAPALSPVA